jgi:hypothetical protein
MQRKPLLLVLAAVALACAFYVSETKACDSGYNNMGTFIYHSCSATCSGSQDLCETDGCICGGPGYLQYCIGAQYCGQFPGCRSCLE